MAEMSLEALQKLGIKERIEFHRYPSEFRESFYQTEVSCEAELGVTSHQSKGMK